MERTNTSQRILLVDDEEAIRLLYQLELQEEGYTVKLAASAKDAFSILAKTTIDLVIMDIRMPGMDGIEAMQKIVGKGQNIPIIINSTYSHFKNNYLTWLAEDYVVKSPDLGELKNKIKSTLHYVQNDSIH